MLLRRLLLALMLVPLFAAENATAQSALGPVEGPADSYFLSPYDLKRVVAGDTAPDFHLQDENGKVHQLSQYRGKNVVLVMYRGHW